MEFVYIHIRILSLLLMAFAMPLFLFVAVWGNSSLSPLPSSKYENSIKTQITTTHRFNAESITPANTSSGQQGGKDTPHRYCLGHVDFKAFDEHMRIGHNLTKKSTFADIANQPTLHHHYGISRPSTLAQRELIRIISYNAEPLAIRRQLGPTPSLLAENMLDYRLIHKNESDRYFWGGDCEHQQRHGPASSEKTQRLFMDLCLALSQTQTTTPFSTHADTDLFYLAAEFLERIRTDGFLAQVKEKIYDEAPHLDLVSTLTYIENVLQRLPKYRTLLEQIAVEQELDWRLLAAITYQESHWDSKAVSPTGVRGLMMLTKITAKELGVDNRLDPEQSLRGGTRYLKAIKQRFNPEITELDRLWMALASYNVGFGHLQDARTLTLQSGGDPNKWQDVKKYLPLLSEREWYRKTRYGYARGHEPVRFVENIRSYHKILVWLTSNEAKLLLVENDINEEAQSAL